MIMQASIDIDFSSNVNITKKHLSSFKNFNIKKKIELKSKSVNLIFDFDSEKDFNELIPQILKNIYNIYNQFPEKIIVPKNITDDIIIEIYSEFIALSLLQLPTQKINYVGSIYLLCSETFYSLHNLHTFISCSFLDIDRPIKLKENILSLFLLKNTEVTLHLTFSDVKSHINDIGWISIVQKYHSGKDVLECQEELIENGYKEYAKL